MSTGGEARGEEAADEPAGDEPRGEEPADEPAGGEAPRWRLPSVAGAVVGLGRRRAAAALAAVAAVAVLALVAGLVCAGGGGAPPDEAARLVPAGALVYVHLSTDRDRAGDARLARFAQALPAVARLRAQIVGAISARAFDIERDVRPWLGDELAYAAVSADDSVVLAAVEDRPKAEGLIARAGNLSRAEPYLGVRVISAGPTAIAFVGDFLAVGTEPAVHAAIDLEQGDGDRLSDLPAYRHARDGRPDERSLDAYASAAGVREVLGSRAGLLGALGALLDRPGLETVGASLTAEEDGLRAEVRLAGGAPRDAAFEPLLLERVSEGTAAYLGLRSARRLARLLERLGAGDSLERLGKGLIREAGIGFERDLLAPLSGELAITVASDATSGDAPVVTLKARTADERRSGAALARLQEPIARRLAVAGTVPRFEAQPIGGLNAFTLRVTPELAPSYAVADGTVAISTSPAGLEPLRGTLAASQPFEATVGEVPDKADSLVFLDLRALLALGEQTGLTAIPGLATVRDDLSRVRAAGAVITADDSNPSDTTAELFLEIP